MPATRSIQELGAGLVALAAIGLAVWEGWENRTHDRLSVLPKLDGVRSFHRDERSVDAAVRGELSGTAAPSSRVKQYCGSRRRVRQASLRRLIPNGMQS